MSTLNQPFFVLKIFFAIQIHGTQFIIPICNESIISLVSPEISNDAQAQTAEPAINQTACNFIASFVSFGRVFVLSFIFNAFSNSTSAFNLASLNSCKAFGFFSISAGFITSFTLNTFHNLFLNSALAAK